MHYLKTVLILLILAGINNCNNDITPNSPLESFTDSISPGYGTTNINLSLTRQQIEKNVTTIASSGYDYGKYFSDNCTTEVYYGSGKPTLLIFRSGVIGTSENIKLGSTHNDIYKAYGIPDSTSYESKITYTIYFKKRGISFSIYAIDKNVIDINITKPDTTTNSVTSNSIILKSPADTTVEAGKQASFSITVPESHIDDGFQWQKNGVNIPMAIFSKYTTPPVQASDSGATFRCIVYNLYSSDTSKSVILHVTMSTIIITDTSSTLDTIISGYGTKNINLQMSKQQIEAIAQKIENSSLNEYIFNGCSLYVYYHDEIKNVPIAIIYRSNIVTDKNIKIGSQLDSLIKQYGQPDTTYNSETEYQLRYRNGLLFYFVNNSKTVKKIGVYLTLDNIPIPIITVQPVDLTVTEGQVATFSITAEGKNLEYQWSINGVHTGPNSNIFSFTPTLSNNGDSIWCDVFNMYVMVTGSRKVVLHVNPVIPAPQVIYQPANATVFAGEIAEFEITASGSNLSYQWIRNGTTVGSNANTYSYLTTQYNNKDSIWCIVSNAGGSTTSFKAKLTINNNTWIITTNSLTDPDGNAYSTVTIGTQVWTVENLISTKYNDGTTIPHVPDSSTWSNLSTPGYCFYNNTTSTAERVKWGALYNWYVVNTNKLAPAGWHVPTDADWTKLENYLIANGYNFDGTISGNKIGKSLATKTDWVSSSFTGEVGNYISSNNRSGFSALPGGCTSYNGGFYYKNRSCAWWCVTQADASFAYSRALNYSENYLFRGTDYKRCGYAVRLVKN